MTYPFPREFKDKIERLPGSHLLRHDRVKQLTVQAVQFPVYARGMLPETEKKKFIVYGQGRTGSTLLVDLLNTNPEIYCDDELFFYKLLSPSRYIEGMSQLCKAPVYGFKAKTFQVSDVQQTDPGLFLRQLSDAGWTIIHIVRENLLRHSLSAVLAEQRQVYSSKDQKGASSTGKDYVPVDQLIAEIKQRGIYGDQEAAALQGLDHITVSYENDLAEAESQQRSLDRIFAELDVESVEVHTSFRRLHSNDLQRIVENYDEMAHAIAAAGHEKYLAG